MKEEIKRRAFPMFSTYRPIRDTLSGDSPESEVKFLGLSAPFPVSGRKMLEQCLHNAAVADLHLVFVGFFDPLAVIGDDDELKLTGGLTGVRNLVPVDDAESFGNHLRSIALRRGLGLFYRFEIEKEGESDVQKRA